MSRKTDSEVLMEMLERNKIQYRICSDRRTIEIEGDLADVCFIFNESNDLKSIDC